MASLLRCSGTIAVMVGVHCRKKLENCCCGHHLFYRTLGVSRAGCGDVVVAPLQESLGPGSVRKVSRTLRGHSRDTFWTLRSPGPEGPWGHPPGHSVEHPDFRGHSVRHSRGHSGPKGPRDSCRWPTMSQVIHHVLFSTDHLTRKTVST